MLAFSAALFTALAITVNTSPVSPSHDASELQCTKVDAVYVNPRLYSTTFSEGYVPLVITGVEDASKFPYLQQGSVEVAELGVYECNSSYMGYISDTDGVFRVSNGHIRIVEADGKATTCLTVSSADRGAVTFQPCSMKDDVSQTKQFWHVEQNRQTMDPASIRFLGNVTFNNGDNAGFYSFGIETLKGATVVTTSFAYDTPNTDYQVELQFIP